MLDDTEYDRNDMGVPLTDDLEVSFGNEPLDSEMDEPESNEQVVPEQVEKPPVPQAEKAHAPVHWAMADRDMFEKQNPDVQRWLLERDRAMTAAHTRRSQEIAPMRNAVAQWKPYLDQVGVAPEQAFNQFMQFEQILRTGSNTEKLQLFHKLAQDYKLQPPQEGQKIDSNPELLQMRQQLQQMQAQQGMMNQQNVEHRYNGAVNMLENFKNRVTEAGELAHPYFGEVVDTMAAFVTQDMENGLQPNLEEAYQKACWANPAIRSRMESERARVLASRKRQVGSQIAGAGSNTTQNQNRSLRDTLTAAYNASAGS